MPDEAHSSHYFDAESDEIEHSSGADLAGGDLTVMGLEFHVLERQSVESDGRFEEVGYESFEGNRVDSTFSDVFSHHDTDVVAFVSPVSGTDKGVLLSVDVSERARTDRIDAEGRGYRRLRDGY